MFMGNWLAGGGEGGAGPEKPRGRYDDVFPLRQELGVDGEQLAHPVRARMAGADCGEAMRRLPHALVLVTEQGTEVAFHLLAVPRDAVVAAGMKQPFRVPPRGAHQG